MDKKISDGSGDDDVSMPSWGAAELELRRSFQQAEDDFRIRSFALDMAVQALPHLGLGNYSEGLIREIIRKTAADFEEILRGES